MAGNKFKLVKSVTELKDGDIVIVAKAKNDIISVSSVLSNSVKTAIEGKSIEIVAGIAAATEEAQRFKLDNINGDTYRLYSLSEKKYLCNDNLVKSTSNKTAYRTNSDATLLKATSQVKISFDKNGNVDLCYLAGTSGKNKYESRSLYFYSENAGDYGCFNLYDVRYCYSENRCVQLYKLIEDEVALNDENDNTTTIATNAGSSVNVTLSRTLVAGKWNTFCVPFDIALSDGKLGGVGATVMEYADVLGNVMMFTEASKIEAGKAYLVKPEADISNPRFEGVNVVDKTPIVDGTEGNYTFRGVYSPKSFSSEESRTSLIVAGDASLSHPSANSKMKGMRAYFTTPEDVEAPADATPRLMIDGQITGVSDIVVDMPTDDSVYGVDGVQMSNGKSSQKGIYIRNGKKYMAR